MTLKHKKHQSTGRTSPNSPLFLHQNPFWESIKAQPFSLGTHSRLWASRSRRPDPRGNRNAARPVGDGKGHLWGLVTLDDCRASLHPTQQHEHIAARAERERRTQEICESLYTNLKNRRSSAVVLDLLGGAVKEGVWPLLRRRSCLCLGLGASEQLCPVYENSFDCTCHSLTCVYDTPGKSF